MDEEKDSLVKIKEYNISLPVFEGPLDLLLYLIRKNEVDIYNIPIEKITKQYLDTLFAMERQDLEVAGEFFVMAATLMYIKSRMLLPKSEQAAQEDTTDPEEEIDPRWELVEQLLEYKKFKEAATNLQDLIVKNLDYLPRQVDSKGPKDERPLATTDEMALWETFNKVLHRLSEKMVVGEIHDETVTVADRMEHVLGILETKNSFHFSSLFKEGQ